MRGIRFAVGRTVFAGRVSPANDAAPPSRSLYERATDGARSDRPIPSSTARAWVGAPGAAASSPEPVIASEKRSAPTRTAVRTTPAFMTMPPGSAPSGGLTSFFQRLIGTPHGARTAKTPARHRSGAIRRPARGGRCTARPRLGRRRPGRARRPGARRAPATPARASGE